MKWIKSGIENPSKSEVIGRCGGDEKTEWPRKNDQKSTTKHYLFRYQVLIVLNPVFICLTWSAVQWVIGIQNKKIA